MPEGSQSSHTIIEAAQRFEARRTLARFETGENAQKVIQSTLRTQPNLFQKHIEACSPMLGERLLADMSNGIQTEALIVLKDPPDTYSADNDYQVIDHADSEEITPPKLVLRSPAIEEAFRLFDRLYASAEPEEVGRTRQLEAAVTATAWMALGKWTFDQFDPRQQNSLTKTNDISEFLSTVALIADPQASETMSDVDINDKLVEYRYRLMGALAYDGWLQHASSDQEGEGLPNSQTINVFRILFSKSFAEKVATIKGKRRYTDRISTMEYAFANPLTKSEVRQTIDLLTNQIG